MKWETTAQPATTPVSDADAFTHMRLHDDAERPYVIDCIKDATAYAESEMECSLVEQTITAIHFESSSALALPRGPVLSITSVTVDGVAINASTYDLKRIGNCDYVEFSSGSPAAPIVIEYRAGYTTVPRDIRRAILNHTQDLYDNRGVTNRVNSYEIENGLRRVYERHRRTSMVG